MPEKRYSEEGMDALAVALAIILVLLLIMIIVGISATAIFFIRAL